MQKKESGEIWILGRGKKQVGKMSMNRVPKYSRK